VLQQRAVAIGIPVFRSADWLVEGAELDPRGSSFTMRKEGEGELRIACPLAGEHQVENAVAAAVALLRLGIPAGVIEQGIAAASWPGRLERVSTRPDIVLDGAHNPSAARALAAYMRRFYKDRRVTLIYGAMRDKAVAEMAGILFPAAHAVIATAPRQERATRPETISALSGRDDTLISHSVAEALLMASGAGPDEAVFVTGSLFVVGEARGILRSEGRLL
jgi:dihydrofolate synthase/folylpolyglutamate synthase